ncbi:HD family phosphohydrolase [Bacillus seohaeanensis]|jgi:cyclic-di-AMP phosphodiesterase PgpH|uniref:HD family phosphohydrolase n=1 Tax=Bacillus seohaeanensis TaxID=284580 RepID=A0ABW5RMM6_9BACI
MQTHPLLKKIRLFLSYRLFTNLIFVLLAIIVFGVLFSNVKPKSYNVDIYEVPENTIRAPKTITDDQKTQEKREKAIQEVEKVYIHKEEAINNSLTLIDSLVESVAEIKRENAPSEDEGNSQNESRQSSLLDKQLTQLKERLTSNVKKNVTDALNDKVLTTLLSATDEELQRVNTVVTTQVKYIMNNKVYDDQLDEAKLSLEQRISTFNFTGDLLTAAVRLGNLAIEPTEIYDNQKTEELKKEAEANVQPVKIIEGEVIVKSDQIITPDIYRQLELLGIISNDISLKPLIGLGIFIIVLMSSLYYFFYSWDISEEKKQNYLILTSIVFVVTLLLMKIVGLMEKLEINDIGFLFPAAFAGMIIRILLNERIAMIMVFILSACASLVFHNQLTGAIDIEVAMYTLFSGISGVLFLSNRDQRANILRAGFYVVIVNILIISFLILLRDAQFTSMEYVYYAIFALVSGIGSAILTIGFLPFFEAGFGILSAMRLVELSNPNHPLLKKLLTEAPGTYHHSVMVANLAEAACESIGANGLLARVGCYYHDVGKTKRPHFFIENQMNMENPHNHVSPETSKNIIISHATDGAEMLRKHKLPKEIVDIAEQHHGTTLLKFFYHKTLEQGNDVQEEAFRYPGPKPQSREAAVINIADSVEAAVRSMSSPTPEEIKKLVNNIINDRLQDGQFDECDLTLKQIQKVKHTLCETLNGIFHSRIEYPELKTKGEDK